MTLIVYAFVPEPYRALEPQHPRSELFGVTSFLKTWVALGEAHDLNLFLRLREDLPIQFEPHELDDLASEVDRLVEAVKETDDEQQSLGFRLKNLLEAIRLAKKEPTAVVTIS